MIPGQIQMMNLSCKKKFYSEIVFIFKTLNLGVIYIFDPCKNWLVPLKLTFWIFFAEQEIFLLEWNVVIFVDVDFYGFFCTSGNFVLWVQEKKVSLMNYNIYNLFMFLFVHFNFINCYYFEFILTWDPVASDVSAI